MSKNIRKNINGVKIETSANWIRITVPSKLGKIQFLYTGFLTESFVKSVIKEINSTSDVKNFLENLYPLQVIFVK